MTWVLVMILTSTFNILTSDLRTYLGPYNSEKSCREAKLIIEEGVEQVKFVCLKVEKK